MSDELTPLSDREMEIVRLLATGATNQQIAQELVISVNTVKVHLRNIYHKLDVGSRTEATMVAVHRGWVAVPRPASEAEEGQGPSKTLDEPSGPRPRMFPPVPERWSRIAPLKRLSLIVAMLVALTALFLPQMRQSRANGGTPDPIKGVFPTPTAATGPPRGRWRTRAQMPTPRSGLAVVAHEDLIYAVGGVTNEGTTGKVEIFDPASDTWTAGSPKPTPAGFVAAAVVEGKIYVPGGIDSAQQPLDVLEVYDPGRDIWETLAPLPKPVGAYALAAHDGHLYLFGGLEEQGYTNAVYRYDPRADVWEVRKPLDHARGFLSAATVEDAIYVAGGFNGEAEFDSCSAYDPASDTWTSRAPMALRRGGLALVAVRGTLYAIGGGMDSYLAFNERYDSRSDVWSRIETPVTELWRGLGSAYVKPQIYAIGGWSEGNLSVNEAYQALFVILVP